MGVEDGSATATSCIINNTCCVDESDSSSHQCQTVNSSNAESRSDAGGRVTMHESDTTTTTLGGGDNEMVIGIRRLTDDTEMFLVSKDQTIADLKAMISEKWEDCDPVENQRLLFRGRTLESHDQRRLADIIDTNGAILNLVVVSKPDSTTGADTHPSAADTNAANDPFSSAGRGVAGGGGASAFFSFPDPTSAGQSSQSQAFHFSSSASPNSFADIMRMLTASAASAAGGFMDVMFDGIDVSTTTTMSGGADTSSGETASGSGTEDHTTSENGTTNTNNPHPPGGGDQSHQNLPHHHANVMFGSGVPPPPPPPNSGSRRGVPFISPSGVWIPSHNDNSNTPNPNTMTPRGVLLGTMTLDTTSLPNLFGPLLSQTRNVVVGTSTGGGGPQPPSTNSGQSSGGGGPFSTTDSGSSPENAQRNSSASPHHTGGEGQPRVAFPELFSRISDVLRQESMVYQNMSEELVSSNSIPPIAVRWDIIEALRHVVSELTSWNQYTPYTSRSLSSYFTLFVEIQQILMSYFRTLAAQPFQNEPTTLVKIQTALTLSSLVQAHMSFLFLRQSFGTVVLGTSSAGNSSAAVDHQLAECLACFTTPPPTMMSSTTHNPPDETTNNSNTVNNDEPMMMVSHDDE